MADEERERGKVWGLIVALPIAVVLGLLGILFALGLMSAQGAFHGSGDAFEAILAGSIVTAAVVWGVLYLTFIRTRAPEYSLGYFMIILAAIVIVDGGIVLIGINGHAARTQSAMAPVRDQDVTLEEIPQLVHVAYSPHGGAYRINSRSTGAGGDVARAVLEWMKAVSGSRDLYESDIRVLNPDAYMQASTLAAPGGLARARAVLAKMRDSATRHRAEEAAATAKFRAVLAGSGVDPAIKGQMFTSFDSSVARERGTVDAIYADDTGVVAEYDAILARLAHPAGVWYVDGNLIRFSDHSDLVAFKAHIARAKQYAAAKRAIFNTAP
jgi:hypothetical protein